MYKLLLLSLILTGATWCNADDDPDTYAEMEEVDIDQILKSERLMKNYMNCFMERGKCTPLGKTVKEGLPSGLQSGCPKCSKKIRDMSFKVIKYTVNNKPEWFIELEKKYDPTHEYRKRYKDDFKARGLNIPE